jgi:simple sugar transport system permease protein
MLTALCVAIPARAGLTSSAARARWCWAGWPAPALPYVLPLPAGQPPGTVMLCWPRRGRRAAWIALAGWLRQWRGVNETISSLLLAYIAIALFKHIGSKGRCATRPA